MDSNPMPSFFWRAKSNLPKLIRFGIVGSVGAGINLTTYYAMTEILFLGANTGAIAAFCVAVTNNYLLNHQWTFSAENENRPVNLKLFMSYLFGNLIGLLVNLLVLNALIAIAGIRFHLVGQLLGISCGMMFNFVFAKKIVFSADLKR